ncbi:MAG: Hsp20/alpha crystallin family protein [Elusimicrobiota bacterium]
MNKKSEKAKKVKVDKIKDTFREMPDFGVKQILTDIKKDVVDRIPEVVKSARYPRVDMTEQKDRIVIEAEIPGLKADEISVSADENSLTITGKSQKSNEKDKGQKIIKERRKETFSRTLGLPAAVDVDKAQATRRLGLLTVKLPKTEESKKTELEIE